MMEVVLFEGKTRVYVASILFVILNYEPTLKCLTAFSVYLINVHTPHTVPRNVRYSPDSFDCDVVFISWDLWETETIPGKIQLH